MSLGEKLFPHFICVDEGDLRIFAPKMDFVFVPADYHGNMSKAWDVIRDGGHLVVLSKEPVTLRFNGRTLVYDEYTEDGYLRIYRKRKDEKINIDTIQRPDKCACVVRYGGYGDMIQTSSVLPGLKEQGFHVTVCTTQRGKDILREDPFIDEFYIQDKDQVPNAELGEFWKELARKFDRFINFSESVEGTFLALPGRTPYFWPQRARHAVMNHNYLEFMHILADVPLPPKQAFYPTKDERAWARKQKKRRSVLWCLSGSSVHKAWPYLDQIVARILIEYPDVDIFLCGDELSKMLEAGWENEPRVKRVCGKWSIRETLAFAQVADLVVGPETGVLNAVGLTPVPKIVTLSHSSEENLCKYWNNYVALKPVNCPCYPCHMMHYGFQNCPRDKETGCSLCQANISPEIMWGAIRSLFDGIPQ